MQLPPSITLAYDNVAGRDGLESDFERIAETIDVSCHQAAHLPPSSRIPTLVAAVVAAALYDRPAVALRYAACAGTDHNVAWHRLQQRCLRACSNLFGPSASGSPTPSSLAITVAVTSLLAVVQLAWATATPLTETELADELILLLEPYLATSTARPLRGS